MHLIPSNSVKEIASSESSACPLGQPWTDNPFEICAETGLGTWMGFKNR